MTNRPFRVRSADDIDPGGFSLASRRKLPPLLFITSCASLAANIGKSAVEQARDSILKAGHLFEDLAAPHSPENAAKQTTRMLKTNKGVEGVVVLGGYDVVSPFRMDAINYKLRKQINVDLDADRYFIWSDDLYGDVDGDREGELPVSRIPDGRSEFLVRQALNATVTRPGETAFGIRNVARPFADKIYFLFSANGSLCISEPHTAGSVKAADVANPRIYLMLHGSDIDATAFWGESSAGDIEAFSIKNISAATNAVVFTGCCWGALCVADLASEFRSGFRSRHSKDSIALRFLEAGCPAFIGCTGSHYSPTSPPYNYHGAPLHAYFWQNVTAGKPPARALFDAKIRYVRGIPHGPATPTLIAREQKIFRQYTCLGLGW